jgi:transposase
VPPETRDPVLLHHPTRRSVGYFGAVRLRDGRFVYRRETERFGGETFFDFLRQLDRATRTTPRQVVVILDNAAYHHARLHRDWREAHQERLRLEFLPPYSPELNPIERACKFTRRRCLHNRYFPQLERVVDAVEGEFAGWHRGNDALRRLCAIV